MIITGTGRVLLTDKDREITFMQVQEETIFVEPTHLLACEETLTPRYVPLGGGGSTLEFLALEGTGMVALSVASKPLPLTVTPDLPVSVPAVVGHHVERRPHAPRRRRPAALRGDAARRARHAGPLIRLEGAGRLLVEQSSLGGLRGPQRLRPLLGHLADHVASSNSSLP